MNESKGIARNKDGKMIEAAAEKGSESSIDSGRRGGDDSPRGSNRNKRPLRFPIFRKAKLDKGLFGPKYQHFKKEMDRRFEEVYSDKLAQHRVDMQRQRQEKVFRLQMQA